MAVDDGGAPDLATRDVAPRQVQPVALTGEARAMADQLENRFRIGGVIVAHAEAAGDQPLRVVGLLRTGRRTLAYVNSAEGPRRLSVGATYGG